MAVEPKWAVSWKVDRVDSLPPSVKLHIAVGEFPQGYSFRSVPQTATIELIHMDARAAMALYQTLGDLGRKEGWLPQSGA